jgi:hypothetical protein
MSAEQRSHAKPQAEPAEQRQPGKRARQRGRERRARLDAAGRERPPFLASFPQAPELKELIEAYQQGNYARVRREAPRVANESPEREVREAARELLRRIEPDPLAKYLLLAAVLLLAFLVVWAYQNQ